MAAATTIDTCLVSALHTIETMRGRWLHCRRVGRCHRVTNAVTTTQTSTIVANSARRTTTATRTAAAAIYVGLVAALLAIQTVRRGGCCCWCLRRSISVAQTVGAAQTQAVVADSALQPSGAAVAAATTVHIRLIATCHTVQTVRGSWLHRWRLRRNASVAYTVRAAQTCTIVAGHAHTTGIATVAAATAVDIGLVTALDTINAVGRCRCERWRVGRSHRVAHTIGAAEASTVIARCACPSGIAAMAAATTVHIRLVAAFYTVQTMCRCRLHRWRLRRCHRVANAVRAAQTSAIVA